MTVEKNIAAGLHGSKLDIENRVARMIEKFQLKGLEKRIPKELSGGQQQRVALARIMAYEPDIIMLDEPFSALDMFLKDRLQEEMIDMLKDYSGTIIIVSHNRDEIYRFSDELLIMDKGRHVCFGKTKDIFANPLKMEAAKLTGCKNISKIRKIDDFHLMATDWGIKLETDVFISDNIRYVGIRAHDLEPVWDVREKNCLRVDVFSISELPFETQYYLRPESESNSQNTICWYVSKHTLQLNERYSIPQYLRLPKNKLLLLT